MTYKLAAVAVLALAVAGTARAASNQGSADEDNGSRTFAGLHFGVALSVTHDLDDNRVEDAIIEYELENGTAVPKVRVTRTNNTRARLMLALRAVGLRLQALSSLSGDTSASLGKGF